MWGGDGHLRPRMSTMFVPMSTDVRHGSPSVRNRPNSARLPTSGHPGRNDIYALIEQRTAEVWGSGMDGRAGEVRGSPMGAELMRTGDVALPGWCSLLLRLWVCSRSAPRRLRHSSYRGALLPRPHARDLPAFHVWCRARPLGCPFFRFSAFFSGRGPELRFPAKR